MFPDPGVDLCFLHWQVDSLPLSHQGSPPENGIGKPVCGAEIETWTWRMDLWTQKGGGGKG